MAVKPFVVAAAVASGCDEAAAAEVGALLRTIGAEGGRTTLLVATEVDVAIADSS